MIHLAFCSISRQCRTFSLLDLSIAMAFSKSWSWSPDNACLEYCLLHEDGREPLSSEFERLSPLHWGKVRELQPIFVCVTGEIMRAFKFEYKSMHEWKGKDLLVYVHTMGVYRDMGILIHEGGPPEIMTKFEILKNEEETVQCIHWQFALTSGYLWSKFFFANVFGLNFGIVLLRLCMKFFQKMIFQSSRGCFSIFVGSP